MSLKRSKNAGEEANKKFKPTTVEMDGPNSFREGLPTKIFGYGNWCGPGWTAGQAKDAKDITRADFDVPAQNALDAICKKHDIDLFLAQTDDDVDQANRNFQRDANEQGITGKIFSWLVGKYGPNKPAIPPTIQKILPQPNRETNQDTSLSNLPTPPTMSLRGNHRDLRPPGGFVVQNQSENSATDSPMGQEVVTEQTSLQRAIGGGPTSGPGQGETGVDYIDYTKFHPYKKVEQVLMPYVHIGQLTYTEGSNSAGKLTFRLNSIYDCIHTLSAFTSDATPAADTFDVLAKETPAMRAYWEKVYNYWHVVKCDWKFTYRIASDFLAAPNESKAHQLFFYEHGRQDPPVTQTTAGGASIIPWYIRKFHPHVRQRDVKMFAYTANIGDSKALVDDLHVIQGVWKPGDIQHEVAEDQFTQVWHKFTEVPPTAEKLTIMLQPRDGFGTFGCKIQYWMELNYTVQLKDLKTQYEYITQATSIAATADIGTFPTL